MDNRRKQITNQKPWISKYTENGVPKPILCIITLIIDTGSRIVEFHENIHDSVNSGPNQEHTEFHDLSSGFQVETTKNPVNTARSDEKTISNYTK